MTTIYDARLLLVDDNADLLRLLCEQLQDAGYRHIRTAQSCSAARACFAAEQPELMILDINLPDGDGFSLFRALRAKADVPALFLSARDADADRLFGLGLGADDYLTKPFLMQELLLRVQHILQRAYRAELSRTKSDALRLGGRSVDLNAALVTLPDGRRAGFAAQAGREPGPHRHLRRAVHCRVGRGLLRLRKQPERPHPPPAGKAGRTAQPPAAPAHGAQHRLQAGKGGNGMKTFGRLIRRYVLAAVGMVLVLAVLCVGFIVWLGWRESTHTPQAEYSSGVIADAMVQTAQGLAFGPEHTPEEWMDGYAWAMVLDDDGDVVWSYALPEHLARRYTPADVARFARWYLDDYPVFCWTEDYGLFVIAMPQGSIWKYNLYNSPQLLTDVVNSILPAALCLLALGLAVCLLVSGRGAKQLRTVAAGLDALAEGQPVQLPTDGFAGEVAEKLNQTSAHLQKQGEMLARRDTARTQWIAGVSHDVRTPLALILGWAEQLERDPSLPGAARQKAGDIRTQSEKLRSLIDDLNLTSKLQYGAQPLRRQTLAAGPLVRQLAAQFCESPLADRCELSLTQTEAAERALLDADPALLGRLLENLLNNSVRHNAGPVKVSLCTEVVSGRFCLTVADDGAGYPPQVLAALHSPEPGENAPHILGLHVVEQIAAAHGGQAVFGQAVPHGAKTTVWLPLHPEK